MKYKQKVEFFHDKEIIKEFAYYHERQRAFDDLAMIGAFPQAGEVANKIVITYTVAEEDAN